MDDADLNNNIDEQAQAIDGSAVDKAGQDGAMHDQSYLNPSRWWFASAAFPMIAGTLGPVASAFSICALVKNWRQHILPGSDVTKGVFVEDPPWLLAVNGVQLVIALVANAFLLLNMTKRVRFSVAQPVTIVGWYISAACLISLCATTGGPLLVQPEIEYVWSQAFYYGMYAAILYFIVASLMVVTVWGARAGHYGKDFELTMSQRTLMLQTIVFLTYLLLGALVFSNIEGWNYLDAVYWADTTLFTVGFGDISPQTRLGRGLLVPYALVGVISLGLVIGSIRSMILDRGKHRLDARMLERQRRSLIRRVKRKGNGHVLEPVDDGSDDSPSRSHQTELERRQKEFQLMRKVQRQSPASFLPAPFSFTICSASTRKRWTAMAISSSTWVVLWLVGAKIFQVCEAPYQGWSYFDGFYFAFTALTTIGYGDLTPVSNSAKSFFVFWSLLALPTMTVLISNAGDTIVKGVKDGTLLLGNVTILPGEHGFRKSTKQVLAKLSCGMLFADEDIEEDVPGFLGAARLHPKEDDKDDGQGGSAGDSDIDNLESNREAREDAGRGEAGPVSRTGKHARSHAAASMSKPSSRAVSIARENPPTALPERRPEYHLILMDEITRVTQHLRHTPPRRYTFKEWSWYLRLIGEDESNAGHHRKPEKRPPLCARDGGGISESTHKASKRDGGEKTDEEQEEEEGGRPKWSWVGHRSPLMDSREEAEWILDQLEQKLRRELQAVVRESAGRDALREVSDEERRNEQRKSPGSY
ncbi:voltage-gated potassium channel [Hypoxylon sp. FL1284]|nr:voltage-gated potassium channel [Hypoxylon sp. FL1284]